MALYRKKPVVIEATQWFKMGDHIEVEATPNTRANGNNFCNACNKDLILHGQIKTLETFEGSSGQPWCPGDWIIKDVKGEYYACKPDIFEQTYEPATTDISIKIDLSKVEKLANIVKLIKIWRDKQTNEWHDLESAITELDADDKNEI